MAKFYGNIGFAERVEVQPGVWDEKITERSYYGDVIRHSRMLQNSTSSTNDNINVSNEISIVADPYAYDNYFNMRYIVFMGAKWKISNVNVIPPRLELTIGGLYNA